MLSVCCGTKYTHSSLLAGSHCAVSQFSGTAPRIKIHHSVPEKGGASKLFDYSEQYCEPYRIMLKGLKEKEQQLTLQCFYKENTQKKYYDIFIGSPMCFLLLSGFVKKTLINAVPLLKI